MNKPKNPFLEPVAPVGTADSKPRITVFDYLPEEQTKLYVEQI